MARMIGSLPLRPVGQAKARSREVFTVGERGIETLPVGQLKGDTIGQTQPPLARLAAPGGRKGMKSFVHPNNFTARKQHALPSIDSLPSKPRLNQRPSLMDDVTVGHQRPLFGIGAAEERKRFGMIGIVRVQSGIKTGGIDENRAHLRLDSKTDSANHRSCGLSSSIAGDGIR
jgi:hypothetical protein